MTSQEKVAAKIKELQEAVTEAKGNVMIIGVIDTDEKEKSCVITGVTGYAAVLSEAIAHEIMSADETNACRIIKKGFALAHLYGITETRRSDVTKVEISESNNQ